MRLAWMTDLHLDHAGPPQREGLSAEVRAAQVDAVLIGGDTAQAASLAIHLRTLRDRIGVPVYFVLGNHDCYGSSIAETRATAERLTREVPGLVWLGSREVVRLTDSTALIGHDGWGDAGFGNPRTPVRLNDFLQIAELRLASRERLISVLKDLGAEAGRHLGRTAAAAVADYNRVITLTHVPPFRQAAWYQGAESSDDWLPFFACRAAGEALARVMKDQPQCRMTALCGHTHGGGRYEPLPNLEVITGAAEYGEPRVQQIIEVK